MIIGFKLLVGFFLNVYLLFLTFLSGTCYKYFVIVCSFLMLSCLPSTAVLCSIEDHLILRFRVCSRVSIMILN